MSTLNIQREEAPDVWDRIKKEYDECTACMVAAGDGATGSLPIFRAKYGFCYSV